MSETKRTLKQIAAAIEKQVNFVRVGFNPESEQTKFICIINGQSFEYSCGIMCIPREKKIAPTLSFPDGRTVDVLKHLESHFKAQGNANYFGAYQRIRAGQCKAIKNWMDGNPAKYVFETLSKACEPTTYDILYCLQGDCRAEGTSFMNWCSEFGYDNDSIKAQNIYSQCIDEARKLRLALGTELYNEIMACEDIEN